MAKALARPIRTARDRKGVAAVVKKTRRRKKSEEPDAEHRLQALLEEIDKFDSEGEEGDYADPADDVDDLPRRRWSDDISDEA